jgi:hypothetical protein
MRVVGRGYLLTVTGCLAAGCMQIPAHYRQPIRAYPASTSRTVAVEGFVQDQFRVTGEAGSAAFGNVNTSREG